MLDFLLVLGQIPGTNIQLNFFEICALGLALFWLLSRRQLLNLHLNFGRLGGLRTVKRPLRTFVLWLYFELHKPTRSA